MVTLRMWVFIQFKHIRRNISVWGVGGRWWWWLREIHPSIYLMNEQEHYSNKRIMKISIMSGFSMEGNFRVSSTLTRSPYGEKGTNGMKLKCKSIACMEECMLQSRSFPFIYVVILLVIWISFLVIITSIVEPTKFLMSRCSRDGCNYGTGWDPSFSFFIIILFLYIRWVTS